MSLKRFTLIYLLFVPAGLIAVETVTAYLPDPSVGLPVDPTDLDYSGDNYGIWPFGVRGLTQDSHPEGHPGIDFFWNHTAEVYAVTDGYIAEIKGNDHGQNVVFQKASSNLFVDFEYACGNLSASTTLGAFVRRGDIIGYASVIIIPRDPTPGVIHMIHFGAHRSTIFTWHTEPPARYFDTDAQAKLGINIWAPGTVMNKSTYAERNAFPLLTNPVGAEFIALYIKIPSEIGWGLILLSIVGYVAPVLVLRRRNRHKIPK